MEETQATIMHKVIGVTCALPSLAGILRKELRLLQNKGVIDEKTTFLVIPDPGKEIGSGGATLNALLVIAEHLSALNGHSVVTSDVLQTSRILIINCGRQYAFDPLGKMFCLLPEEQISSTAKIHSVTSNFLRLFDIIRVLSDGGPPGVWVCSTDMILSGAIQQVNWRSLLQPGTEAETQGSKTPKEKKKKQTPSGRAPFNVAVFCTSSTPEYATKHGVVRVDKETGGVKEILYQGTKEELESFANDKSVSVFSGIIFLTVPVAESLLTLHSQAPVNSCTYFGLDHGSDPLQVSLVFDVLVAMCEDLTKSAFLGGECGKNYRNAFTYSKAPRQGEIKHARELVWDELRRYRMKCVVLDNLEHNFLWDHTKCEDHVAALYRISPAGGIIHSHILSPSEAKRSLIVNSYLQYVENSDDTTFVNCFLKGTKEKPVLVGPGSYINGIYWDANETGSFVVPKNTALVAFRIPVGVNSIRANNKNSYRVTVLVVLDTAGDLNSEYPDGNVFGVTWSEFIQRTGININDLWSPKLEANKRTLLTARLFPVHNKNESQLSNALRFMDLGNEEVKFEVERWQTTQRLSLADLLMWSDAALSYQLDFQRYVYGRVTTEIIRQTIQTASAEYSLLPYFRCAAIEGWSYDVLNVLDKVASSYDYEQYDASRAARTFATIADVLGAMAGKNGGLRSGPAANREWVRGLKIATSTEVGSIDATVLHMKVIRSKWLNSGERIMRAARHYEGAAHCLIRSAVSSCLSQIKLSPITEDVTTFSTITAECPCRLDLHGAWTDTPPICYELGSQVVNASILVNNLRPIGAKVTKKIVTLEEGEGDNEKRSNAVIVITQTKVDGAITLKDLNDLRDFSQPGAEGALIKACLVCSELVTMTGGSSLAEQLKKALGVDVEENQQFRLEIEAWSNLPQGSGLGTSSILAAAVIAVLWRLRRVQFTRFDLVQAVLHAEQLMTTGGGWQDQVGGVVGGVIFGSTQPSLPISVKFEQLKLSDAFISKLNQHLVLLYTGKVRLAKNLLQNVVRKWYSRDEDILKAFKGLHESGIECADKFKTENLEAIAGCMSTYWGLKKQVAPGCEPDMVGAIMKALEPHVISQSLAGAGGGGFLYAITKQPNMHKSIKSLLAGIPRTERVEVYDVSIDREGLVLQEDGKTVDVPLNH